MPPKRGLTRPTRKTSDADEQAAAAEEQAAAAEAESCDVSMADTPLSTETVSTALLPVRVLVYLAEGLKEGFELHIMCKHMPKLHGGSRDWSSRLQPAGDPAIAKAFLHFIDVPRPPRNEDLVFRIYQSGNWKTTKKVMETVASPSDRIYKLEPQTSFIFVPVMCTFHHNIRARQLTMTTEHVMRSLCGFLGKEETRSQVWFAHTWADLCTMILGAFGPPCSWNIVLSQEAVDMAWDAFKKHMTEDPGGAVLRFLRFLSPHKMSRKMGEERANALAIIGECLIPAMQKLKGGDAAFKLDAMYVRNLDAHLKELQDLYRSQFNMECAVAWFSSVFFLRSYLASGRVALDVVRDFLKEAGVKSAVEKNFMFLQNHLLQTSTVVGDIDYVVPFLVLGCRSFEHLDSLVASMRNVSDVASRDLLRLCILRRIQLPESWCSAPILSPQDVRPSVNDIVKLKSGMETRILKDDGQALVPFRMQCLHSPLVIFWRKLDDIEAIIKAAVLPSTEHTQCEKMQELNHLLKLICDHHDVFGFPHSLTLFEAMLKASCWMFDPGDPNRHLLRKPLLGSFLLLHNKAKHIEDAIGIQAAHAQCLKSLRERAEVIMASESSVAKHTTDIMESAMLVFSEICHGDSTLLSDADRSVLKFGHDLFEELLPDELFTKRLNALLLPIVARVAQPLQQVLMRRAKRIAFKGGLTSRIEQLKACLLPLTTAEKYDGPAIDFVISLADEVLAETMETKEPTVCAQLSPVQAVSPEIMNILHHADLWKCVYNAYERISWSTIAKSSDEKTYGSFVERIELTRSRLVAEKDRISSGSLLVDTLLFFVSNRDRLQLLDSFDNNVMKLLDTWTEQSRSLEDSEKVIIEFLQICIPQCRFLKERIEAPLRDSFATFTSNRRRAQHVCKWEVFPLVAECREEMNFLLRAQQSRSARQLWKDVGNSASETTESDLPIVEAQLIKDVHQRFFNNLKDLLLTIDRGAQTNSALKPFILSLQKDIRPPEPPPKGLSQKEARAFIVKTQQTFRAEVQSRAEDDISHLLKLFQTSNIELVCTPQVLVDRFKNIYRMWQTRAKVGALYGLLTPASRTDRSIREVLPDAFYNHRQYQLLSGLMQELDKFESRSIEESLKGFEDFTNHCPEIQDTLELTLSSLSVAVRKGLLTELREFADPAEFITFQERWLADFSEGVEEDVCVAFGRVREALQNVVYGEVRNRTPQTVADFLLELNSLSIADLSLLCDRLTLVTKQRMRKGELAGLTALERSWQLLMQGDFEVSLMRNGAVQFIGKLLHSKDGQIDSFSQEDLFDLRNQVVMAEIPRDAVETDDGAQPQAEVEMQWKTSFFSDDAGATIVSKPEQRLFVIQKFSWLLDKLREMAKEISHLRDDGHVNYQAGEIKVKPEKEMVEQLLKHLQDDRRDWSRTLNNIRRVQPLLSLLFPKELVQLFNVASEVLHQHRLDGSIRRAHIIRTYGIFSIISSVTTEKVESALERACGNEGVGMKDSSFDTSKVAAKDVLAFINHIVRSLIEQDAIFTRCALKDSQSLVNPAQVSKLHTALGKLMIKPVPFSIWIAPIHASRCPELTLLAYHAHLRRLPTPFEVLICSKRTALPDLLAFLKRWSESCQLEPYLGTSKTNASNSDASAKQPLLFCLGNIQELPSVLQIEMQKELLQLKDMHTDSGRPCMPLVMLTLSPDSAQSGGENLAVLGGLRSETESLGPVLGPKPPLKMVAWKLLQSHLECFVSILASSHPCAGKTRHIRVTAAEQKLLYCSLRVTDDMLSLRSQMATAFNERRLYAPSRGLALHLDVAHNAHFAEFNEFLFNLFVHRSWSDQDGILYILEGWDHLFIEVPSQGRPGDHCILEHLPLCQALRHTEPPAEMRMQKVQVVMLKIPKMPRTHRTLLHEVQLSPDPIMGQALQWLHALNTTKDTRVWPAPDCSHPHVATLNAHDVLALSMDDASCNWSPQQMAARAQSPENLRLFQMQRVLKYVGPQFEKIRILLTQHLLAVEEPGSEMYTFYLMYQWLLVQMVVRSARSVSVSAVAPPKHSNPVDPTNDHVSRFQMMNTFYKSDHSFVIMDKANAFCMISMSEVSVQTELLQNYPESVPNLKLFRTLLAEVFHFDLAAHRPLHDLRQRLVDLKTSRKTFWELFDVRPPLLLLNSIEEYEKAQGRENEDRKLKDAHEQLLELGKMHPNAPRVDETPNRLTFSNDARKVLDFFWQPDYTVTVDNLVRLLHVHLRLSAGIPVFFMGETGCGKTSAIHFLARMMGCPFFVVNVHGGMRGADLWKALQPALTTAEAAECDECVYLLLDESNAMADTCAVKDVLCNQMCEGYVLPDNLRIMSLMNPTRFKPEVSDSVEGGMDCNEYYESLHAGSGSILESTMSSRKNPFSNTVYPVYEVPESVLTLVWDWGNAADQHMEAVAAKKAVGDRTVFIDPYTNAETIHIEALVEALVTRGFSDGGHTMPALMHRPVAREIQCLQADSVYWPAMRSIITAAIARAQHFIRYDIHGGDGSAVSLRDIKRCVKLILWILELYSIRRQAEKDGLARTTKDVSGKLPRCSELQSALLVSITQCYALRLNKRKADFKRDVIQSWQRVREAFQHLDDEFMPTPPPESFFQPYNDITRFVCDQVKFEPGVARNEAMRENIFSLFVGICTRTSTFLVGKPGSSKSSSMDAVAGSMQNREHPFWGKFPRIHKKTFQCGPLDTPESIYDAAYQVARLQVKQGGMHGNDAVGALILEEIGVTALSPYNPLMSLHSLIDHGVLLDGQLVPICIIGISNWRVDPAKVNRAFMIFRGDPSPEDIQLTGQQIIMGGDHSRRPEGHSADDDDDLFSAGQAQQLSSVLGSVASVIWESIIRDKTYNHFYGLRDYYGLVKFLHRELTCPLEIELGEAAHNYTLSCQTLQHHLVRWAISQNLSCLPFDSGRPGAQLALETALERALVRSERDRQQPAVWQMSETREALCSTCARGALRFMKRRGNEAKIKLEKLPDRTNRVCTCSTPPVLHRIAWNLEDSRSRYLMLVTRDSQALYLLFSTGLARSQGTLVVTGSDLADDNGDAWTLKTLQKIQNAMRLGLFLVLVKCRRLYENLLDMTNQHFLVEGGRKYTRLSMQAHSRYFYVHDSFSLAILVEEDEVNHLPPPWLNRFEKANFTYTSVLGPEHHQLQQQLSMLSCKSSKVQSFDLWQTILPGFTSDTLSSLVFEVVGAFKGEANDKARASLEFQLALFRISAAASSRMMMELYCNYEGSSTSSFEELRLEWMRSSVLMDAVKQLLFTYFHVQAHDTLREVLARGQQLVFEDGPQASYKEASSEDEDLERRCPWGDRYGLTLAIMTEQFIAAGMEDSMLKTEFQSSDVAVQTLNLETIASDHDVDAQLNALFGEHDPAIKSAYLFISCDVSGSARISIRDVMFQCHERRCGFIEMQGSRQSIQRNLVFICKAGNLRSNAASRNSSLFKLYFDARWHWIFVDTLFAASGESSNISLNDYVTRPLFQSQQDLEDAQDTTAIAPLLSMLPERNVFSIKEILHERMLDVVKNLLYPEDTFDKRYEHLRRRASDFRELLQTPSIGTHAILERVYMELQQAPQFREEVWLAHPLQKFDQALSVKENLLTFLTNAVIVIFKELVGVLDSHRNLRFASDASMAKLWAELFRLPFVSGSPGGSAITKNLGTDPEALLIRVGGEQAVEISGNNHGDNDLERCPETIDELVYPADMQASFPFSCDIAQRIFQYRDHHNHLDDILAKECPLLLSLGCHDLRKLAEDVLSGAFGCALSSRENRFLLILSDALSGGQSISQFFQQLWSEDRLFVHMRRLVAWGVQPNGWATDEVLEELENLVKDVNADTTMEADDPQKTIACDDEDAPSRKKQRLAEECEDGFDENDADARPWKIRKKDGASASSDGIVDRPTSDSEDGFDENSVDARLCKRKKGYADTEVGSLDMIANLTKSRFLIRILRTVVEQLFIDVLIVDRQGLLHLESAIMGPIQKLIEMLSTTHQTSSDSMESTEDNPLGRILRRWDLWQICYTLKKRVASFPDAVIANGYVHNYIKHVSSRPDDTSHIDLLHRVHEFLELLADVAGSADCLFTDKNALSSCVVPVFRLCLPIQSCDFNYEVFVPALLNIAMGSYNFDEKRSHSVLSPVWLHEKDSDATACAGVPLTYSIASAFISWILNWCQSGPNQCSLIVAQLSKEIEAQPLGERSKLGVLVGQVCFDRLCSIGASDPVQHAISYLQSLQTSGAETALPLIRILVVTTLNFLLQSYADVLTEMKSERNCEDVIADLERKRVSLRPAITTVFQSSAPSVVQEITDAMQLLSGGRQEKHRHFILFFLRRLSRNGLDCDHARKILNVDAGRVEGSFRNLLLPRSFHEQKLVVDFCQPPPQVVEQSAFALCHGFETARYALSKVLKNVGNCDAYAEAFALLNGSNPCWPMPGDPSSRIVALTLAIVHHSFALRSKDANQTLITFLNQVPWFGAEHRLHGLLQALLDPNVEQSKGRQWLDSKRRLAEAVLHFVVLLLGAKNASASAPSCLFMQILDNGLSVTERSFVPGVTSSAYLGVLRAVPPAYHVYQGGCGHMFVTGECPNIASAGICPECRTRVGAASYGQGLNGTRRLGSAHDVLQQWDAQFSQVFPTCTGFRPDGCGGNRSERNLPPVVYRVLRFCIESAALVQAIFRTPACGKLMTFDTLCAELEKEVFSIKDHLFSDHGDETSTFLYLHSAIAHFGAALGQFTSPSWPLPDEHSRRNFEACATEHMERLLGRHLDEVARVRTTMDAAQEACQRSLAVEEIKLTTWFLAQSQDSADENSLWNRMSSHWIPRTTLSVKAFWAHLDAHPGLPVLKLLREYGTFHEDIDAERVQGSQNLSELTLLKHLPTVAYFLRLLLSQFSNRLARNEASITLQEAIDGVNMESPEMGRKLLVAADAFETSFRAVWPQVHAHMGRNGCINFNNPNARHLRLLHRKAIMQIPLECFLPSQEGDGVVATALFARLSGIQRQFLVRLKKDLGLKSLCSLELRPLTCTAADILRTVPSEELATRLAEHVVRDLGFSDTFSFVALEAMEDELLSALELCQKPFLAWEPPEVRYTDEFARLGVLAALHTGQGGRGRVEQELLLPSAAEVIVQQIVQAQPAKRDQLLRYFLVLASLAIQGGVRADQLLWDFTSSQAVKLLLEGAQQRTADSLFQVPQLRNALRLSHLRSLASLLWDAKVHESFDRETNEMQKDAISTVKKKLVSSHQASARCILAALRRHGYEQFSYFRFPETVEKPRGSGIQVENPAWNGHTLGLYLDVDIPDNVAYPRELDELSIRVFGTILRELSHLDSVRHGSEGCIESMMPSESNACRSGTAGAVETIPDPTDLPRKESLPNPIQGQGTGTDSMMQHSFGNSWQSSGVSLDLLADFDFDSLVIDQLNAQLLIHGKTLDLSTPKDGHCLFHAMRKGGLLGHLENAITIQNMRDLALNTASQEQLETVATEQNMPVDQYVQRMRQNDWGDNLMVSLLSVAFQKPITLVTPAMIRTFFPEGHEVNEPVLDAVWIAYNNTTHYYGVVPID